MILDRDLRFSASQALTVTATGTNVIDLSVARSVGSGEPMCVVFVCENAADQTTGDEDYTFDVETSSDAAQTTARKLLGRRVFESGTPVAPAEDADLLVAGFKFMIPIPSISASEDERYLGVRYVLAGTSPLLTVSAYMVPQSMYDDPKTTYASGYSIV